MESLWRYKWIILAGVVVGTAGGFGLTRVISPLYVAEATLRIATQQVGREDAAPVGPGPLLESYAWIDLLKSYEVLEDVVRELRLYVSPGSVKDSAALASFDTRGQFTTGRYRLMIDGRGERYVLMERDAGEVDRGLTGDSIGRALGFMWAPSRQVLPADGEVEFAVFAPRDAAQQLGEDLDVQMDPQGRFLRLRLRGTDPGGITAIVNAVAGRYVEVASDLKRQQVSELRLILGEQLATAESSLTSAEAALRTFQEQQTTPVAPEGDLAAGNPAFANYFDMRVSREQARRDREAIDQVLRSAAGGELSVTALERIGAVRESSELMAALTELTEKRADLRAHRYRYTDEHPLVQRLAGQVDSLTRGIIPALARQVSAALRQRQTEFEGWIGQASAELRQVPGRSIEEARLRRQIEIANNLYTTLEQRHNEVRLAEASSIPDVRVLDAAVTPTSPVENTTPKIMAMSFMGSLGISVLGVLLLGRIDRRVRNPEQVSFEMGLPILGALPHVRGRGSVLSRDEASELVEALRGIRLSVLHAYGAPPPLLVTITSPGSGDGKSFVSSRLALAFADAGYRTLVIDGDVRRGQLHRVMGRRRKPGLIDHLAGRAALHEIVQPTGFGTLDLIASGTRSQGGPELLGSAAMKDLLATVRAEYGVILVDSAPMAAAVDPFVLGTATGNLMLVLRTGLTDRELASAKLTVLDRLPIRPLGAIVNDVRDGASYHLYSYYLPGYESENEDGGAAPGRKLPASI